MRSAALLALVALAACHAGPAASEPAAAPVANDASGAVKGALEQWRQAYEVHSIDALARSYAHDPELVFVEDGQARFGWEAVDTVLNERLARASAFRVRLKDVHVTLLAPDVATAVATMAREATMGAATAAEAGTLTLVFHRTAAGWVIVVEAFAYRRSA